VALPNKQPLLLTDTVGFVRKLPHRLVEAFNATLEEAAMSDFLIHLLDASQPEVIEHYNTTLKVLAELGADERPTIVAFNKIDKVAEPGTLAALRLHFPDAIFLSVRTGEGLDELIVRMGEMVAGSSVTCELLIPQSESALIARLHAHARILETGYEGDSVRLVAVIPPRLAEACVEWISPIEKPARTAPALQTDSPPTINPVG
jgi:GTPase